MPNLGGYAPLAILILFLVVGCKDKPAPTRRGTQSTAAVEHEIQRQLPKLDLLSAKESAAAVELPPGYALEVVVSEPQVEEPVMVAWDGNGRMYVAEMRSFMQNIEGHGQLEPHSRILRFEDRDNDGTYEIRTVFADNLVLPRALLPLDHRLLVMETNSRNILCLSDEDDDGVADSREVVIAIKEPDQRNLEHQDSNLLWNIDNWVYSCQGGLRHRLSPEGIWQRQEILTEQNQWGLTQDDTGQMYFADNTRPARDFQQHWIYWNLMENDLISGEERQLAGPNLRQPFFEVWPLIASDDAEASATELRDDGTLSRFTCACGQHIYRGDALPKLTGNLFVCEPVGRLVRRGVIREQAGRKFIFNPHKKSEFLRSKDYFFRPVHIDTGPDGHLYVVDMNRGIIQESAWLVKDSPIRSIIEEKGLDRAKRRGRILRLVKKTGRQKTEAPRMLNQSAKDLVRHLEHKNGWWRDTAQRLLVLKQNKTVVSDLLKMLKQSKFPLARLHALWTLDGLDSISEDILKIGFGDVDWRVRAASIRISEPWLTRGNREIFEALSKRVSDPHGKVLQQAVLSLATGKKELAWPMASNFIRKNWNLEIVRMATITGFHKKPLAVFEEMKSLEFFNKSPNAESARGPQRSQNEWLYSLRYEFSARRPVAKYRTLSAEGEKILHRGSSKFQRNCVMCHGSDASGVIHNGKRIGAKLSDSDRVLGNPEGLALIMLHGLRGQINGQDIGVMIPYASQDDSFIADILSALRWSQRRSMVTKEFVADIRKHHQERRSAWTLKELGHSAPSQFRPQGGFQLSSSHESKDKLNVIHDRNLITNCRVSSAQKPGDMLEFSWDQAHEVSYLVIDSGDSRNCFAHALKVEVANNNGHWVEVGRLVQGKDLVQELKLEPRPATKLRITLTAESNHPWVIHEVALFGCVP